MATKKIHKGARLIQARRLAEATPSGHELLSFLESPAIMKKLEEAAARGIQPVGVISTELLAQFPTVVRDPTVRRRLGIFVAALLHGQGFEVERANVKLKNSLFASGAVFRKRPVPTTPTPTLISRLAGSLTLDESRELVALLSARFPGLKKGGR